MEDTLRELGAYKTIAMSLVLILVLMEDTLRVFVSLFSIIAQLRLNPCFNGRYSQRLYMLLALITAFFVLILVLMEDTLRGSKQGEQKWRKVS